MINQRDMKMHPPFLAQKSQTQFPKRRSEHNSLYNNQLTTNDYRLIYEKQSQSNPNKAKTNPKQTQTKPIFKRYLAKMEKLDNL